MLRSREAERGVAFQIEVEALEEARKIRQPLAALLEHLHPIVEAFDEPTCLSTDEMCPVGRSAIAH
jgi:hypothetical protein